MGAYAVPAALVWGVVALILNLAPLGNVSLALLVVYGGTFGVIETREVAIWAPASSWQIPSSFVIGVSRRRKLLVWGSILGPGFVTRNPYAGFTVLPLAVGAMGSPGYGVALGVAVGTAHGAARAIAAARDGQLIIDDVQYSQLNAVIRKMRWRVLDGLVLLLIVGLAAAALVQ